jgi:DNA replication and repair protein RecF
MFLKNLRLSQFKNYQKAELDFSPEINCLLGINGSGKTNLLDAIHYLCLTKSAFQSMDNLNVQHGGEFFTLLGDFDLEGKNWEIRLIVENGKKKQLLRQGKAVEKMSEHVGLLPIVLIAPDDTMLIKDGSEERRRFFDGMICQVNHEYLDKLMRYQHFLKQRNALLKQFAERGNWKPSYLEPYDREILSLSNYIAGIRRDFLLEFEPKLKEYYRYISDAQEPVGVTYETECLDINFEENFGQFIQKDIVTRRTNMGIHKDDFLFSIGDFPIKKFGSQGQQKSYVIALKLAQFQILHQQKETKPLLLLDDIFDKLDDKRIGKLMELVADHRFGQLFITDARPERSRQILSGMMETDVRFFTIEKGKVASVDQ